MEGVIKRLIDHLQSKRVSQGFCLLLALDELKPERGMSVHGKPVVFIEMDIFERISQDSIFYPR